LVKVLVQNVLCEPDATDHLRLPACLSWQQPGAASLCSSPSPTFPWVEAAVPGSPSKCACNVLSVPIIVQRAAIDVTKSANVLSPTGTDGSEVDYTVVVTNKSNEGPVTITKVCDDKYGTVATSGALTCAAGTLGTALGGSCSPALPATLANPNDS